MLEPSPEFIAARAEWERLRVEHKRAREALEAARSAAMMRRQPAEPVSSVSSTGNRLVTTVRIRSKIELIAEAFEAVHPELSDRRLQILVEDLAEAEATARSRMQAGISVWDMARGAEQTRIARAYQPAHRAAIGRVGAAIQALSNELMTERDVRAEAERIAGGSLAAALPDAGVEFRGTLADPNSALSAWAARMRAQGVL